MKTKAAILHTIGKPLDVVNIELPSLNEGQYLIKILYTSVCGSQLNEIRGTKGEDKYLPHLLGHEAVGIVLDKHPSCRKINIDDVVICSWINGGGLNGGPVKYGKYNAGPIATFTEYAIISENKLHAFDKKPNPIHSILGCAVPTGFGAVQSVFPDVVNKNVLVIGAGAVGFSIAIALSNMNANIFIRDIDSDKLNDCKSFACIHDNEKCDYIFDCTGSIQSLNSSMDYLTNDGTLVVVGNTPNGQMMTINPYDFIFGKKIIGHNGNNINMPTFLEKMMLCDMNIYSHMIGSMYNLEDINDALSCNKKPIILC